VALKASRKLAGSRNQPRNKKSEILRDTRCSAGRALLRVSAKELVQICELEPLSGPFSHSKR
jgi:hypothetical protein